MKYNICIIDKDKVYLDKLKRFMESHYSDELVLHTFDDIDELTNENENEEAEFNAVFTCESETEEEVNGKKTVEHLVMKDTQIENNSILKYQKPDTIWNEIKRLCEENRECEEKALREHEEKLREEEERAKEVKMIYRIAKEEAVDKEVVELITEKNIKGIAPVTLLEDNVLEYQLNNKISLKDFIKRNPDDKKKIVFLHNFFSTVMNAEENSLKIDKIMLTEEDIFVDEDTLEIALIYYPLVQENHNQMKKASELLTGIFEGFKSDFVELDNKESEEQNKDEDNEAVTTEETVEDKDADKNVSDNAAEEKETIENEAATEKVTSEEKSVEEEQSVKEEKTSDAEEKKDEEDVTVDDKTMVLSEKIEKTEEKSVEKPVTFIVNKAPITMGETEVLMPLQEAAENSRRRKVGGIGETVLLNQNDVVACLIRKSNNEKIYIYRDIFKLGKEKRYVDYWISDNTAISRSHADIVKQNGSFFVIDHNSMNHTFVNGKQIPPKQPVKLEKGNTLVLADEAFEFQY